MNNQKPDSVSQIVTLKALGITAPKKPASRAHFSVWVCELMQNWRQGTVGTKGRADVSYTTKKPWKQKGTGRARAGSARSPLWRGGGVTFGPQARTKKLSVPSGVRKKVFAQLFADRVTDKKVIIVDWALENDRPKTAKAAELIKSIGLVGKKLTIFLSLNDTLHSGSFANIPQVQVLLFDQVNAYDLANSEYWLVLKKDVDAFKHMVKQWQ